METIGDIKWPVTAIGQSASLLCSEIHSSFSSSLATRRCNVPGLWESVDISRCTFKNGTEENEIVVVVSESGRSDVESFKDEIEMTLKVPNTCTSYIVYITYASRYVHASWNVCNYTINIESQICLNDKNATWPTFISDPECNQAGLCNYNCNTRQYKFCCSCHISYSKCNRSSISTS